MRELSATLTAAQETGGKPLVRVVLTKTGQTTQTYTSSRILDISHTEQEDSQITEVLLNNSDGTLTTLNLRGYTAVISRGYTTSAGDEYSASAPQTVISQDLYSAEDLLVCLLKLAGIPNMLESDKASDDYEHFASSTKTVEDLFTEIADGQPVTETLIESQTTVDINFNIYSAFPLLGQRLMIRNRTITKVTFKLSKSGTPTGNITFFLKSSDEQISYASKVWGNASSLTGTPTDCEVTLDTPVTIDDEVFMYCEFGGGDVDNYIRLRASNSNVISGQNLIRLVGGVWVDDTTEDCYYTYTYTGGGVTVFDHCTSYTVMVDSRDSLINVYTPKDGFIIRQGESRLSVLKRLLVYTGCVFRCEDDGEIHVFVPTTSGTYDYEYSLASGYHPFFSKSLQQALVIPNKITVQSYPDDDEEIEESATDATSYALVRKDDFIRAKLASSAQATSIAQARIGQLQRQAQTGSALVQMNVGAEIHDYINVTDSRQNDSRIGNIGWIKWHYKADVFDMTFGFGKLIISPVIGLRPSLLRKLNAIAQQAEDPTASLSRSLWRVLGLIVSLDEILVIMDERIDDLEKAKEKVERALGWIDSSGSLARVNSVDSQVGDAEALVSQEIQARKDDVDAVEALLDDATWSEPTRALDTIYQNTSGKLRLVVVSVRLDADEQVVTYCDAATPPTVAVANVVNGVGGVRFNTTIPFIVSPNYFYKLGSAIGVPSIIEWHEWDLH